MKIFVPPHAAVSPGGKPYRVSGYWRIGPQRASRAASEALGRAVAVAAPPAPPAPLADSVDLKDYRKGGGPLSLDRGKLEEVMRAAGVRPDPGLKIKLRLWSPKMVGEQGLTQQIGPTEFRVVVKVAPKDKYEDRHLYVLNNSLLHEMRHVAQHQRDPQMSAKYTLANVTVGYESNPYEVEARYYGRLADATGTKDTGGLGPARGKDLWAFS